MSPTIPLARSLEFRFTESAKRMTADVPLDLRSADTNRIMARLRRMDALRQAAQSAA